MTSEKSIPRWANFIFGGISGMMAATVVHPADLLKTRKQLLGPMVTLSTYCVVRKIVLKESISGFYAGLSASLCRQATYTTGRLGCFYTLLDFYKSIYGTPSFPAKLGLASLSGGMGAIIGNPAEVALIRMTADGQLPPEKRRHYRNVFNAITRIVREEGMLTLLRGGGATIARATIVNAAQLATYAQAREKLVEHYGDSIKMHIAAAMLSSLITTMVYLPIDIVKTRVQQATKRSSQLAVLMNVIRNEGALKLWTGFVVTYARLGPQTVLMFLFLEQLAQLYSKII